MMTHEPDGTGSGAGRPEEMRSRARLSRRHFLAYSAAGASAPFLLGPASVRAGTPGTLVPHTADTSNFVVQATPSSHFVQRDNGAQEMRWGGIGELTLNDRLYIHNRARPPDIDLRTWRLELTGDALTSPRSFTYDDLLAMPAVTLRRTIDCGANCSAFFPKLPPAGAPGHWLPTGFTQWHFGAVGAAAWTGVRAKDVLAAAGVDSPVNVKFTGLDVITDPIFLGGKGHYSEVIAARKVLADDTLLAYRMNGEHLPVDHGFPLRLILSGWAAVTFVKWLGEIEASKRPIAPTGPSINHVLTGPAYPEPVSLTVGKVRSAIEHEPKVTHPPGDITLRGRAWSGSGAITRVDVSVERLVSPGRWVTEMPWVMATLLSTPERFIWTRFEVPWPGVQPGQYRVMSRATDEAGNVQPRPEEVVWNQHGLGYNGHHPLGFNVLPRIDMP
jgi:DMSO/TMAO reductase YedYZ molybdopterin-dependent catalytic subunit